MTVADPRGNVHTLTLEHIGRELYARALQADECYTQTVSDHTGKDRWTLSNVSNVLPAIQTAYDRKAKADAEWLVFLKG